MSNILPPDFYAFPAYVVAPKLLGCRLVRIWQGKRLAGLITETEAYQGEEDQACHARVGKTARTAPMYGPAGHAYIYFTYGMHWLLNVVTDMPKVPAAVLIRAIFPVEGLQTMKALRPSRANKPDWLNGPAKLTQALGLDGAVNCADLCTTESGLFIEAPQENLHIPFQTGPRVGIESAGEPWRSIPWRWIADPKGFENQAA